MFEIFEILKSFCILYLAWVTSSYNIITSVNPQFPKLLKPCPSIDTRLLDTVNEISINFPRVQLGKNKTTGYICNQPGDNLGYTSILQGSVDQNTNIWISNKLLDTPNTLYNVVLHEVLHSMGLNHSDKQGMMNYSVRTTWFGNVIDDPQKLWISKDDRQGLRFFRETS